MDKVLKIVFSKKTSSKSIPGALRLSKKLNGIVEGDTITIDLTVQEVFNLWEWVNALLNIVDKWRSFEIYYKSRLCVTNKDYRQLFYAIQEIRRCYYNEQDNPEDFEKCNQGWGCHKVFFVALGLTHRCEKVWYQYGHFVEPNVWVIDKLKILNEVQIEIERKYLKVCPAFPKNRIQRVIDELPNEIILDENWEVSYKTEIIEGVLTEIADSIEYLPEVSIYTKAILAQINKDFGSSLEDECPYQEGTNEWSDWLIDKNLRKPNL